MPVASSPSGSTGFADRATIPELHRVVVALDLGGVEAFVQRHAEPYRTSLCCWCCVRPILPDRVGGRAGPDVSESIEGTVAGDVFHFKNPRGTSKGARTVRGDEMESSDERGGAWSTHSPSRRSIFSSRFDAPVRGRPTR